MLKKNRHKSIICKELLLKFLISDALQTNNGIYYVSYISFAFVFYLTVIKKLSRMDHCTEIFRIADFRKAQDAL